MLPQHHAPSESAVDGGLVQYDGVLNVVPRVGHDGNARILPPGDLIEVDEVQGAGLDHGLMRVDHGVDEAVHAGVLIEADTSYGLLPHRARVRVPWALVVVGVGHEARHNPQDRHRIDLEVSVPHLLLVKPNLPGLLELPLRHSDEAVVLLVHVNVLHHALTEEIAHIHRPHGQALDVTLLETWQRRPLVDDDEGTAHSPPVGRNVNGPLPLVQVHRDELPRHTPSAHPAQIPHEPPGAGVRPDHESVQQYEVRSVRVRLIPSEHSHILRPHIAAQSLDRSSILVGGDVRQQREVLDKSARLPLGRISGAEHPPLTRLEGAGSRHLSRLLELGVDAGHHPDRRHIR
mmetsp:Transcript_21892/g.64605  ORF Transcript_21892/g.64605 Transcript_21892/m.64605 type:complete len:346 (-) Transcript_21892:2315-3352(-)